MVDTAATTALSLEAAYATMLRIRMFEDRCLALRRADVIQGSIHLCNGQEAVPTGVLAAIPGARVVATYRGHGWALACGVPMAPLLAEICGRATGLNGGRGGSPYFTAPDYGFMGETSIVGAGLPIACGLALAAQVKGSPDVAVVTFGDGALSQGAAHEALIFAAARRLPVVFVCENNGWAEMTPTSAVVGGDGLTARIAAYGIPAVCAEGTDPIVVASIAAEAAERARAGGGPTFLEFEVPRIAAHYSGDVEQYRPADDRSRAEAADPLARARGELVDGGLADETSLAFLERAVAAEVDEAVDLATHAMFPDVSTARRHVLAELPRHEPAAGEPHDEAKELTYGLAVNEALRRELASRPDVVVYGEDIAIPGGTFGVTRNLQREFGEQRVFDTPIAEAAILGSALGASLDGLRPIVEIMWADFLLVALDQLINQAANVRYVNEGRMSAPLVVRCQQGATPGSCAQHSQSLEALLAHVPGLRVGIPSTPQDAYDMLRLAVALDDPVILFEARALYLDKAVVRLASPAPDFGGRWLRRGDQVSIVSWGRMAREALRAAEALATEGIDAGVLDLRWLNPLDLAALADAVEASGRILIAHEANVTGGFGAEVAAAVTERCFDLLDAPPVRVGTPDVRIPASSVLMSSLVPDASTIADAARALVRR